MLVRNTPIRKEKLEGIIDCPCCGEKAASCETTPVGIVYRHKDRYETEHLNVEEACNEEAANLGWGQLPLGRNNLRGPGGFYNA